MRSPPSTVVTDVQVVRETQGLAGLEPEWRELAVARGNAFVTPEWFCSWLRHYGDVDQPFVVVVRSTEGTVTGLLPLVVGAGRRGTVRFAGSGLGDHFHPVAPKECEPAVAEAAGHALRSERRAWSGLVLENVDAESAWWGRLSFASGCGNHPFADRHSRLPFAQLGGDWEAYLASRSRNLRSQTRRRLRALERDHEVRVRWTGPGDDLSSEMATFFRLHDLRWATRPADSSLAGHRVRAFLADFAAAARNRGWLRLCFLEIDGEPVAAWYGWNVGGRFAYYQAGFDPAWADRSVGFVLFSETIRAATAEGASEYDMLLGQEEFKRRFADSSRPVCTILVAPRLHPARLLAGTEGRLRAVAQRLPHRLRDPMKRHGRAVLDRLPLARRR